jgi:hypothetical protein
MFAILRQAGGRRYEVDFEDDPVVVDVAMSATTVQITMTAAEDDDPERRRFVTVAVPREALITALAVAGSAAGPGNKQKPKLVS